MWFLVGTPSADRSVLGKDEHDSQQVTAATVTPFKQQITPTVYISLQTFHRRAIERPWVGYLSVPGREVTPF